jgi:hypothetical protein
MKKIVVATVIAIWCVPTATLAGERVGDADRWMVGSAMA